jgi:membrane protein
MKAIFELLKRAGQKWSDDNASTLGAALAYYMTFSIAPLLILAIAVSGLVYGENAARGQIVGQIGGIVGRQAAEAIQTMIQGASQPGKGTAASIVGIATLLLGASGVFAQLQFSLNTIWGVAPKPGRAIATIIRQRLLSFAMTLATGFLLLVSLALTAWLAALATWVGGFFSQAAVLGQTLNFVLSFAVITALFAILFKFLPDARVGWRDVWLGSAVTALLFTIGKHLIGLYLGHGGVISAYGAAGSLVVVLVWVYYSAQIFFFGAEITQACAEMFGAGIAPRRYAMKIASRPLEPHV